MTVYAGVQRSPTRSRGPICPSEVCVFSDAGYGAETNTRQATSACTAGPCCPQAHKRIHARSLAGLIQDDRALFVASQIADISHGENGCLIELPLDGQIEVCRSWGGEVGIQVRPAKPNRSELGEIDVLVAHRIRMEGERIGDGRGARIAGASCSANPRVCKTRRTSQPSAVREARSCCCANPGNCKRRIDQGFQCRFFLAAVVVEADAAVHAPITRGGGTPSETEPGSEQSVLDSGATILVDPTITGINKSWRRCREDSRLLTRPEGPHDQTFVKVVLPGCEELIASSESDG